PVGVGLKEVGGPWRGCAVLVPPAGLAGGGQGGEVGLVLGGSACVPLLGRLVAGTGRVRGPGGGGHAAASSSRTRVGSVSWPGRASFGSPTARDRARMSSPR